ncbi:DUF1659 domain-containing protein [Neobacillus vireti]|uniref:DUF1659 domain-containing protein n=1 Tax=Neobacillus vireti LMG 21834 TaxID=1131730 RepID=A0AB94IS79_9BACI|nr:DUF1659 domain-containing protein [Neobacillus vireti]ETI69935.1 hypothetical protein BAVI_04999 [Neobacillus vireti LMG 21834]KLT18003.1 hypothetical protein AA980_09970 [Neobacillus vireti]
MAKGLLLGTKLRLVFEAGMDDEGNPLYKSKTFSNVKKEATVDQLLRQPMGTWILTNILVRFVIARRNFATN